MIIYGMAFDFFNISGSLFVEKESPASIRASAQGLFNVMILGVGALVSGQLGSGNQFPVQLAAAVLMTIPVAIMFFIFQKRIMNTTGGAVKD